MFGIRKCLNNFSIRNASTTVVHNPSASYLRSSTKLGAEWKQLCSQRVVVARQGTLSISDFVHQGCFQKVEIFPTWWEDECVIEVYQEEVKHVDVSGKKDRDCSIPIEWKVENEVLCIDTKVSSVSETKTNNNILRVMIPTYFNLNIDISSGDITVHDKIEGDEIVACSKTGSINVNKLRGPLVKLHSGPLGGIRIGSAVEGCLDIVSGLHGVKGKLLMGPKVYVSSTATNKLASGIDLAALYSEKSTLTSVGSGNIIVGTVQGTCEAKCNDGHVNIGSISGSISAETNGTGGIKAHFDSLSGSSSLRTTHVKGSVVVSIAAPVEVDLELDAATGELNEVIIDDTTHGFPTLLRCSENTTSESTTKNSTKNDFSKNKLGVSGIHRSDNTGIFLECPENAFIKSNIEDIKNVQHIEDSSLKVMGRLTLFDDSSNTNLGSGSGKISHDGRKFAASVAAKDSTDENASLYVSVCGEDASIKLRVLSWVQMMREKISL